jgi:Major Facilitator Superfamily
VETPLTIEISKQRTSVRGMPRLSRSAGFWAVAFSFFVLTAFSTAPSSLYGLYEQREHLSSVTITFVYAVYAVGVVVSLLLAAHVSDWYGRRAVLLPAIAVTIAAATLFPLRTIDARSRSRDRAPARHSPDDTPGLRADRRPRDPRRCARPSAPAPRGFTTLRT